MQIWDTIPQVDGSVAREQRCACGSRFVTVERIAKRLPPLGTRTPAGTLTGTPQVPLKGTRTPARTRPVPHRGDPPGTGTPLATRGGVGGGLPSGSDLGPDLGPTSPGDPNRGRARSPKPAPDPAPPKYPEPFEELWAATGRRGGKDAAHRAWVKMGRWPWRQVRAAWEAYMLSDRPARLGAVQDLSTWLNGRGHQQDWPPAAAPVSREERERAAARERERQESAARTAATDRKLAEERAVKARLDAQAAAGAPLVPRVDIRSHVAGLAAQKSAETLDEPAAARR